METSDFMMQIGSAAPWFSLPGTDGQTYSLDSFRKELLVVIFTCNHCPYAQAYEQRLFALAREFSEKADFVAINANDAVKYPDDSLERMKERAAEKGFPYPYLHDDSFEKMKERASEKGFPYPYLHDESQRIAKAYGALVTPHVFVFDRERKLIYQGGVDNNWENGDAATKQYLYDALSAASDGKNIARKMAPVIGCSVKWK